MGPETVWTKQTEATVFAGGPMISDGVASVQSELEQDEQVRVVDVSQLLLESVKPSS